MRWVVNPIPKLRPLYPRYQKWRGLQERSGRACRRENLFSLSEFVPPNAPARMCLRDITANILYRVSQEERTKLREGVPYVKLYGYNPKHLCPKLNGFWDNGKWSLKLWQLLHTYWLPNSYWNWQEYVVSVMLISVLKIKVTCEWHKAINLNCKVPRTHVIIHRVRSTIHHTGMLSGDVTWLVFLPAWHMQGYAFQASVSN